MGPPYFQRKKGQFATVTYLSVLLTLNKSNNRKAYWLVLSIEVKHPV